MEGGLQKSMTMLGFGVRVTERGRTSLGSMLSNKNLWRGQSHVGEASVGHVHRKVLRKNHVQPRTLYMKVSVESVTNWGAKKRRIGMSWERRERWPANMLESHMVEHQNTWRGDAKCQL